MRSSDDRRNYFMHGVLPSAFFLAMINYSFGIFSRISQSNYFFILGTLTRISFLLAVMYSVLPSAAKTQLEVNGPVGR